MNSFTLHIWDDESRKCCFYTVTKDGATINETDKFLEKYENHTTHREALQELLSFVLDTIGEKHGAIKEIFNRHENEVDGLPTQGNLKLIDELYHFPDFPLRIYALRINDEIIILFNGGIKDGPTNQTSSLHTNWKEACQFAKKINEYLKEGEIVIKENRLVDANNDPEIYIV